MTLQNPNTRKKLLMWGLYALLLLVTVLVQNVYLGKFTILGVHWSLLPLLAAAVGVCTGAESGGVFSLCAGLLWALSGGDGGGAALLCLTLCGIFSGWLCDAVLHRRLPSAVLCALLSLTVYGGGLFLVHIIFRGFRLWALRLTLRQIFLTLPLSPLFYWAAKAIRKAGPQHG